MKEKHLQCLFAEGLYQEEKSEGLPAWSLIRNTLFHQELMHLENFSSLGNEPSWIVAVDSSGSPPGVGAGAQLAEVSRLLLPVTVHRKSKLLWVVEKCAVLGAT